MKFMPNIFNGRAQIEATPMARFETKRQSFASQSTVAKKQTLFACQRFVGKPMTRTQAQQKLDTNAAFKRLASSQAAGSNNNNKDLIANAIAFEFGTRLRSCVEESTSRTRARRRSTKSEL